jgi:hypothetical protein
MRFTPQSYRLVAEAINGMPSQARHAWDAWHAPPLSRPDLTIDMPFDVVSLAHDALSRVERNILSRLYEESLSDDAEADLLNELGYVRALDKELKRELDAAWVRRLA